MQYRGEAQLQQNSHMDLGQGPEVKYSFHTKGTEIPEEAPMAHSHSLCVFTEVSSQVTQLSQIRADFEHR